MSNLGGKVVYANHEYGFRLALPPSWKGFRVIQRHWGGGNRDEATEQGPLIVIRHPLYREGNPREDIPIMVFTQDQWCAVSEGNLIVSAAPFPPSEMGRNGKYVFALPPRFSYDGLEGVEEVLDIVRGTPLQPTRIRHVARATRTSYLHDCQ
jgi:hypothetical protein